jgi:hypothetical protein
MVYGPHHWQAAANGAAAGPSARCLLAPRPATAARCLLATFSLSGRDNKARYMSWISCKESICRRNHLLSTFFRLQGEAELMRTLSDFGSAIAALRRQQQSVNLIIKFVGLPQRGSSPFAVSAAGDHCCWIKVTFLLTAREAKRNKWTFAWAFSDFGSIGPLPRRQQQIMSFPFSIYAQCTATSFGSLCCYSGRRPRLLDIVWSHGGDRSTPPSPCDPQASW